MSDFSYLKHSGLFRYFPESAIQHILDISYTREFDEGSAIYRTGDEANVLYGIISGAVKILAESPQGKQYLYGVSLSGQWFGEVSALDGVARGQTVIAQEAVSLFCIDREPLFAMMATKPDLYTYFIKVLCAKVRLAGEFIEEATFLPVKLRLARQLLRFDHVSQGTSLKLSQEDLAASLSVSRQSISRPLMEWQQQGWIRQKYGAIELIDKKQLLIYLENNMA